MMDEVKMTLSIKSSSKLLSDARRRHACAVLWQERRLSPAVAP
jgi:hypothetical protein